MSEEQIKERINDRLTIEANKLEGGFSQDIIGSVAYELANIEDVELNKIADRCFVTTATDADLDRVGADYGIPRREATPASVMLLIRGQQGATINNLVKASFNNLVYTVQEYKIINSTGEALVKAKCDTLGVVGNVPELSINEFITQYAGLENVTNPEPAYDGFNKEDDETYRARIIEYLSIDATNANKAQYHKWATEVEGVQRAVVKGAKDGAGAGNVRVYISAIDSTVSTELKQAVKSHIDALQPINATVFVDALQVIKMSVDADVILKDDFAFSNVKTEFTELFKAYLKTTDNVVSYLKISDLLFSCSGVEDVTSYTLNGGKVSINLTDIQTAEVGNVVIR